MSVVSVGEEETPPVIHKFASGKITLPIEYNQDCIVRLHMNLHETTLHLFLGSQGFKLCPTTLS